MPSEQYDEDHPGENRALSAELDRLKKANWFLESILDNLPVLAFVKNPTDLTVKFWNRFCEETLAVRREQLLGKTGLESFSPEEVDEYLKMDREAIASRKLVSYEEVIETPCGKRLLYSRKVPLVDNEGEVQALLGVSEDITERRKAELTLRNHHLALEAVSNGVVITDPYQSDNPVIYCNPAFRAMTGYEENEIIGRNCRFLQGDDTAQQGLKELRHAMEEQRTCKVLLRNYRKDGTLFWNELTVSPVFNEHGLLQHFVGVQNDMTEHVYNQSLERERTSLRHALKALEQILGIVGHELRTPLAGLRAMTEILLRTAATGDSQQTVQVMHDEVVRMSGIVNDLLEVARLNSGTAKWQWGPVDLRRALEEAIIPLRFFVRDGVELIVEHLDTRVSMNGDQGGLIRLIQNFASNAAKNTSTGEIRISYRSERDLDGEWLSLTVADTGEGIPADIAARLGEAFVLNSGVVGDKYVNGSGLGLAICRGIATAHGGKITLHSTPGKGTTVTARLRTDLNQPRPLDSDEREIAPIECV